MIPELTDDVHFYYICREGKHNVVHQGSDFYPDENGGWNLNIYPSGATVDVKELRTNPVWALGFYGDPDVISLTDEEAREEFAARMFESRHLPMQDITSRTPPGNYWTSFSELYSAGEKRSRWKLFSKLKLKPHYKGESDMKSRNKAPKKNVKPFEDPDLAREKGETDRAYVKRLLEEYACEGDEMPMICVDKDIEQLELVFDECNECYDQYAFALDRKRYYAWLDRRMLIQDAMPGIKPADREILKTHICGKCWKKMFGSPDRARSPAKKSVRRH